MQALIDALTQRQTATEVSLGDLRQTITAQAQQADATRILIDQLGAQITQMMASHDRIHQEVPEARDRGSFRGGGGPPPCPQKI